MKLIERGCGSKNTDMTFDTNILFACDALPILERLPSNTVTLAYLDPPWNTRCTFGRDKFTTFEMTDVQYTDFLSKVVQQVYRILNDSGSLFVHWPAFSETDVRLIMNQAFGKQPQYEISLKKNGPRNVKSIGPKADNELILVYCKSEHFIYHPAIRSRSSEPFAKKDEQGPYLLENLITPHERTGMRFKWRGYIPPEHYSWRFDIDKLEDLAHENTISFPPQPNYPQLKRYLKDLPGIEVGTMWDNVPSFPLGSERTGYVSQKSCALMERIINLASNKGDLVLDPFCGSGTTLAVANSLGRNWWGIDILDEAQTITTNRLFKVCGLEAGRDYAVFKESDLMEIPIINDSYKDVIVSIDGIVRLQQEIDSLNDHLISLRKLMNIGENDDEQHIQEVIKQMEQWITKSVASQSLSIENYISVVCSWLTGWERLDDASQSFLPQAELLFDNIPQTKSKDYSPFIIQYCRALENELLTKLFVAYTQNLHYRHKNINEFLAKDLLGQNTSKFAKMLKNRQHIYTLGDMSFIMNLLKAGGKTLKKSDLLQDFRSFTVRYFSERIVDKNYLDKIDKINKDFRCKAAHPYLLDVDVACRCREQVRACLNELILNYRGGENA